MAASIIAYNHNQYIDVLILGFFISGAIGVKADKILKIWTVLVGTIIIAAAFAAFCGQIENYVYYKSCEETECFVSHTPIREKH